MAVSSVRGPYNVSLDIDDQGFRTYMASYKVETDDYDDGPETVGQSSLIPQIGDAWTFGNDNDTWVWCTPYLKLEPLGRKDEKTKHWKAEVKFTNKPNNRNPGQSNGNPLLEPQKIKGTFTNGTTKTWTDRTGAFVQTTSFEPIQTEIDQALASVVITQNVSSLGLSTFSPMVNTVNSTTLWGMPARTIKLSNAPWERKYYISGSKYYQRTFEFEVNPNTFDRADIPNKGKNMINGS